MFKFQSGAASADVHNNNVESSKINPNAQTETQARLNNPSFFQPNSSKMAEFKAQAREIESKALRTVSEFNSVARDLSSEQVVSPYQQVVLSSQQVLLSFQEKAEGIVKAQETKNNPSSEPHVQEASSTNNKRLKYDEKAGDKKGR